jgi:hypothetical protein
MPSTRTIAMQTVLKPTAPIYCCNALAMNSGLRSDQIRRVLSGKSPGRFSLQTRDVVVWPKRECWHIKTESSFERAYFQAIELPKLYLRDGTAECLDPRTHRGPTLATRMVLSDTLIRP